MDILSHDCVTGFCCSKPLRGIQLPPSRPRSFLAKEVPMARAWGIWKHSYATMMQLPPEPSPGNPASLENWNWNLEAQVSISGPTPFGSLGISGRRASSTVVYTPQQDLRTSKLGRQRQ